MDIIVEDGTGLANSNSYMTADDVRSYATDRGINLPAIVNNVDPVAAAMVLAMDFLEGLDFIGIRPTTTQALQWPRYVRPTFGDWEPALCNGAGAPSNPATWLMPTKIRSVQAQLVIEQLNNDIDLFASAAGFNQGGGFVVRRKTDVIETQFSDKVIPGSPDLPAVMNLLRGLVLYGNGLRTVRV